MGITKILVTGSAGLVGTQIVKDLLDNHMQVYSCYNQTKPKLGIITHLDLTKKDDIVNIMSRIRTVNTFFASYDGELVGISGVGLKDSKSTDDSGKGESTAGEDEAVAAESEDSEEDGV